jgi:hypothetical protein
LGAKFEVMEARIAGSTDDPEQRSQTYHVIKAAQVGVSLSVLSVLSSLLSLAA